MSADPDDMSNNPYAEGGSSARPTATSGGTWFCHQCQRDIADSDLLRGRLQSHQAESVQEQKLTRHFDSA